LARIAVAVAALLTSLVIQPSLPAQTLTTLGGIARLPAAKPVEQHDRRCADVGSTKSARILDTATNLLKNRVDDASHYTLTTIATLLKLPFDATDADAGDMPTTRNAWSSADRARTARYESRAIALDGYLVGVTVERSGETTNCGIRDTSWFDYHMWLVKTEAEAHRGDKSKAVVAEATPRVRRAHESAFDIEQIRKWARDGVRVRVSGWLFLDPDHPDDTRADRSGRPASRGTIWEIHPVMKMEPVRKSR